MYALFTAVPFIGHLNPLLAQARELHRRGWRVAVASLSGAGAHVAAEAPGIRFIDLGPDGDFRAPLREVFEGASRDPSFVRGACGLARGLLALWPPMFDGLATALAADRPDVMIVDLFSQAGICAAQDAAIRLVINNPAVLQMAPLGVLPPVPGLPLAFSGRSIHDVNWADRAAARVLPHLGGIISMMNGGRTLNAFRRSRGLPSVDADARLRDTLILVDDAFGLEYQRPLPPLIEMVGPMLSNETPPLPADVAAWLADGPPVVYANLGTVAIPDAAQLAKMRDAFRSADFRVLWILKAAYAAAIPGPMPPNVRVIEWGPLPRAILASPHVKAFVSHCGPNSVHESLSSGTPIVGIPWFADQLDVAVRVADAGVGVWLWKHRFTAASLRAAIDRVLRDDSFSRRIPAVQDAFARAGGVGRAADLIERTAGVQTAG